MIELYHYIKSDFYKLRNSSFFLVHMLFPILGVGFVLLYAMVASVRDINKIAVFFQIFAIAYPFVISIVCEITAEQEIKAGQCQNILTLHSKTKAILSKYLLLIVFGLLAVLFSLLLLVVLLPMTGTKLSLTFPALLFPTMILWGSNMLLYVIYLILAFQLGKTVCIGVGAVGSLLAALLQTGLGTGLWFVIPYGFGVRLANYAFQFTTQVLNTISTELKFGIGMCGGMTVLFVIILLVWFSRYGGQYAND